MPHVTPPPHTHTHTQGRDHESFVVRLKEALNPRYPQHSPHNLGSAPDSSSSSAGCTRDQLVDRLVGAAHSLPGFEVRVSRHGAEWFILFISYIYIYILFMP